MAVGKKSSHKNAARSRHLIKQAFAELLNEKDMSKITVTDIVERANISRGTFYAHYLDVYDLYTAIQSNIVETLNETLELLGMENIILDPSKAIRAGIDFLDKNKEYYKLFLTSSHGETLTKRIMTLTEEKFKSHVCFWRQVNTGRFYFFDFRKNQSRWEGRIRERISQSRRLSFPPLSSEPFLPLPFLR